MPFYWDCPIPGCDAVPSRNVSDAADHLRSHGLPGTDLPAARFVPQVVAQGGTVEHRTIPCRRCARDVSHDEATGSWSHADGTPACVAPGDVW